jgi:hypothetical protein
LLHFKPPLPTTQGRRVAAVVGATVVLAGLGIVAWIAGGDDEEPVPVLVDERAGRLRGVEFGDTADEVRARLGEPTDDEDGFFPAGMDYTGPPSIPVPRADHHPPVKPEELHYDHMALLVSPTVGVYSMAIVADGARTRAGVRLGDDLERVRERYARVRCGEAVAGEPLFGDDYPTYPWCRALVGETRVFFGDDPIESITLTRYGG